MEIKTTSPRKYYKYGILMIIPFIGLIIGIILLRKGINLKDRLLFYFGLTGIIFTVVFYIWAFYYGSQSSGAKTQKVIFTQFQLNRTIKEIEIYKLKNGYYPDSLQELKFQDIHAPIIDPLSQHFFSKKFKYFFYKKIGNSNYTLFSSGLDQIPNTKDDIYPDLSYLETKKFGLLKNSSSDTSSEGNTNNK